MARSFPRDGLDLVLRDAGGAGRPIVFQHGLLGDARQTQEAFPDDQRFRLLTLECRGHGGSPAGDVERLSIKSFTDDLAAMIDAEAIGPVPVGGISMGAAIALRLAVTRPELVSALILVRPAWVTAPAPENMAPNAEIGRLLAMFPPQRAKAHFLAGPIAADLARRAPDNLTSLLGFFGRRDPAVTAALLSVIAADGPGITDADLSGIAVPTLVLGTGHDAIHPLAHAHALADRIPGARFAELTAKGTDRSRHFSELHAALADFLEGLNP